MFLCLQTEGSALSSASLFWLPINNFWPLWPNMNVYSIGKSYVTELQIRVCIGKLFSLFLIQNICCGYSKEPSQFKKNPYLDL